MKIPEGVNVCCAADLFEYDETKKLNLRQFFAHYKDQLPLLMVILGGHYGDTKFDCYDNLQILRVHCYSSQPRVAVGDPRKNPAFYKGFITIPEDTLMKFSVVKGHTKLGNPQRLKELLKENDRLPLLVQTACDPQYPVKIGSGRHVARDFKNMLIKEKFMEHFFMMNCVDGVELDLNKLICMACLSEDLDATIVTGFKYGTKEEFDEFCEKLSKKVAESGEVYDRTQGNPDFSEYAPEEMRNLLAISDSAYGTLTDEQEEAAESDGDEYEEVPPLLPERDPIPTIPPPRAKDSKTNTQKDKKQHTKPLLLIKPHPQSPKHPKSPKIQEKGKESKGAFGFFKKKQKADHPSTEDEEVKTIPETVNVIKPTATVEQKHPDICKPPPRIPTHSQKVPSPALRTNKPHETKADGGYVTLSANQKYENTKIGRATVKPMPQVKDKTEDEEYLKMVEEDKAEQEYETLDEVFPIQPTSKSSVGQMNHQNKMSTGKTVVQDIQASEEQEDIYAEAYEDMEIGKEEEKPHKLESQKPLPKTPREQNIRSVPSEGQDVVEEVSEFDVTGLSIKEIGDNLKSLKLAKYADVFEENQVDGAILASLSVEDLQSELGLKKLEAIRLQKFATTGHVPR